MGGMHTWIWGVTHPDIMDALVPMAVAAHRDVEPQLDDAPAHHRRHPQRPRLEGWQLHRRSPRRSASPTCSTASAPTAARSPYQKQAPSRELADKLLDQRLAAASSAPTPTTSSTPGTPRGTTTPRPGLEGIQAALLAINAADDERNPPETGIMERELKRVKNGTLLLIPASDGHPRPRHDRHGQILEGRAAAVPRHRPQARDVAGRHTGEGRYPVHGAWAPTFVGVTSWAMVAL